MVVLPPALLARVALLALEVYFVLVLPRVVPVVVLPRLAVVVLPRVVVAVLVFDAVLPRGVVAVVLPLKEEEDSLIE